MVSKVFIFVGVVLITVGVIVTQADANVNVNNRRINQEDGAIVMNYVGGGLACLGLFFAFSGIVGTIKQSKRNKLNQQIIQYGVAAQGTVTYVDKNYKFLVNNTPIYSIVEYTYLDSNGITHTRRVSNVNSELVIRQKIQVGSIINIKYSAQNPDESVVVLTT